MIFRYDGFPWNILWMVDVFCFTQSQSSAWWCPWNVVSSQAAFCCFPEVPQSQWWGHWCPCSVLLLLDTGVMGVVHWPVTQVTMEGSLLGFSHCFLCTSFKPLGSAEYMKFGRTITWWSRLVHGSWTRIVTLHLVFYSSLLDGFSSSLVSWTVLKKYFSPVGDQSLDLI